MVDECKQEFALFRTELSSLTSRVDTLNQAHDNPVFLVATIQPTLHPTTAPV